MPLFEKLNIMAGENGSQALVNDIFKPVKNGFLGEGSCGFVYQGSIIIISIHQIFVQIKI